MLGPSKSRDLDRPVLASLEALVPKDHFYRHLEKSLDLAFVRNWVRDCYAERGRPSVDLIVFFELQLVRYLVGLRSERQLMRLAATRLSICWYIGYDLDKSLPDDSTLTRIRERYGLENFHRPFTARYRVEPRFRYVKGWVPWDRDVDAAEQASPVPLSQVRSRVTVY